MSDCVFCKKIINGGDEHGPVVKEGYGVVSFVPLNPVTFGHRLFVPTSHVARAEQSPDVLASVMHAAARWAVWLGPAGTDYNLIQSNGSAATQTVDHLHVHYVPRRKGDGLHLPWTPEAGA